MRKRPLASSSLWVLPVLLLCGCAPQAALESLTNETEQKRALELLEGMRTNDAATLGKVFDPGIAGDRLPELIEQMSKVMPPREPDERKLVGVQFNSTASQRTANLSYQYRFGSDHFLLSVATLDDLDAKTWRVVGMYVQPVDRPAGEAPEFEWTGKSPGQYAVLLGGLAAAMLSLVALIFCITEPGLRRKWLWGIAILFGLTQFSVDWSTGAHEFKPFHIQLFSFGAFAPAYGGWMIYAALPVGALAYLFRRFRRNSGQSALSNDQSPEPERNA